MSIDEWICFLLSACESRHEQAEPWPSEDDDDSDDAPAMCPRTGRYLELGQGG